MPKQKVVELQPEVHRKLKLVAIDKKLEMRDIASDVITAWLKQQKVDTDPYAKAAEELASV